MYEEFAWIFKEDFKQGTEEMMDEFLLSTQELKLFLSKLLQIALYMVLNDPPIKFIKVIKEYHLFSKSKFYCLDGFPKDNNPCLTILPAPKWDKINYMGIKPTVLVLEQDDVDKEILE